MPYTGPGIYALEVVPHGIRGDLAIKVWLASATGLTLVSIGLPDSSAAAFAVEGDGASLYAAQDAASAALIVGEFTGLAALALPVVIGGTSGSLSLYVEISRLGRDDAR